MWPKVILVTLCVFGFALWLRCQLDSIARRSGFDSLETLRTNDQAVARVYGAPIPYLKTIAIHSWFVIKAADEREFERWEVWQNAGGPYGHVRRNLMSPERDVGAGGVFVIAERIGDEAASIVDFIRNRSPDYPCRNHYFVLGNNSNTYPQWVFDQTGWNVVLPRTAVGKDARVDCD